MRILAAIHPPETTTAILACLGLPTRALPTEPTLPDAEPMPPRRIGRHLPWAAPPSDDRITAPRPARLARERPSHTGSRGASLNPPPEGPTSPRDSKDRGSSDLGSRPETPLELPLPIRLTPP